MKKLFICICFGLTIIGVTGCSDDEQSSESGTSKQISGCFLVFFYYKITQNA